MRRERLTEKFEQGAYTRAFNCARLSCENDYLSSYEGRTSCTRRIIPPAEADAQLAFMQVETDFFQLLFLPKVAGVVEYIIVASNDTDLCFYPVPQWTLA